MNSLFGIVVVVCLWLSPATGWAQYANRLLESTKAVREMDESSLIQLVPVQSGLFYVGCPNCTAGHQERQLTWSIERPEQVTCQHCGHHYPSETYPMKETVRVRNPRGEAVQFAYWANSKGYRYFFDAKRDDEKRRFLSRQTLELAQLYKATGDLAHARSAAILLDRFAQVFPGWCYHYDYPFIQKEIYDGPVSPEKFRNGYRTARWNWWAYLDIPRELVDAFRLLRDSGVFEKLSQERGVDVALRIETDLLRNAAEQVLANREDYTNMSPTMWRSLVSLGGVLEEPRYTHEVVRRLGRLMELQFFYDGFWYEGAPSYGAQTIGNLQELLDSLKGYSDPVGYKDPIDGTRFDNLDLDKEFPVLQQARSALAKMRFPNGRSVPVHDTWSTDRPRPPESDLSYLLPGLGHASLGVGKGAGRGELHLTWSGGYGHQHADLLSLILFANGGELLSDIGYTHTAYRSWTLATAAHNTVVVDGKSQSSGSRSAPTDGSLQWIDLRHPEVQTICVDGTRAYPGITSTYRRTVAVVAVGEERFYAVDLFDVTGGKMHDYFLHGDADTPASAVADMKQEGLPTLLPSGFDWKPTTNEGESRRVYEPHYAYGFLKKLRSSNVKPNEPVRIDFLSESQPQTGLRVTLFPQSSGQLVLGENPSIRRAQEDDAKLENFYRPFMMLRHLPESEGSRFVSVLEPRANQPLLTSIRQVPTSNGAVVLQVVLGTRTDWIVIDAEKGVSIPIGTGKGETAKFQGKIGVLTLRDGKVEQGYALGAGGWEVGTLKITSLGPQQGRLEKVEDKTFHVSAPGATPPEPGDVLRLLTADGWVYPYHIRSVDAAAGSSHLRLDLVEGPGFDLDVASQKLKFRSFPQREHSGAVKVEWLPANVERNSFR